MMPLPAYEWWTCNECGKEQVKTPTVLTALPWFTRRCSACHSEDVERTPENRPESI